jgi:hypothetical protein
MASNSQITKAKRRLKRHSQGKERKRLIRAHGSTPAFPLDPPAGE